MIIPLLAAIGFFAGVLVGTLTGFVVVGWMWVAAVFVGFKRFGFGLVLLAFLFGVWRVGAYEEQEVLGAPVDKYVVLEGRVVEEIDRRVDHQKITVETEYGRVLASASLYQDVEYGDGVEISGFLGEPSDDIEGFDYAAYLARYRVWLTMYDAWVEVREPAGFSVRGVLYWVKGKMEERLNRLYFEPEASFAAGLLLGSRKGMPDELADAFRRVGLTHIVAISGYNISLVIAAMFLCFSFLPLKTRVVVSTVAIGMFVVLVGGSAAVVRAGIMGSLTLWGLFTGRRSQVFFALLWSALLMVIWNPYILVYDVGFQLSFASTFGLLVFVPLLDEKMPKWEKGKELREGLLLTVAAQIATFPFMAFHFGRVSLISPVANVLAVPFLPFAMLFSALSLLCGKVVALVAQFHLKAVEMIAIWLAKLPYIDLPVDMSKWGFVLSIVVLSGVVFRSYKSTLARAFGLCSEEASCDVLDLEC